MNRFKNWAMAICIGAATFPAIADNTDAWRAMLGSVGHWKGQIQYAGKTPQLLDFKVNSETSPDNATLIRYLTYSKPNSHAYAMSLMTFHPETGSLIESYFRNGNAAMHQYKVESVKFQDSTHWKLIYGRDGEANGKPAKLKLEWERQGNKMQSKELVCQQQNQDCQFKLKRETRLKLQA